MLRVSQRQLKKIDWKNRLKHGIQQTIRKYVPDPRDNPLSEMPVSREIFEKAQPEGMLRVGLRPGQSVPEYQKERDEKWHTERIHEMSSAGEKLGLQRLKDGSFFVPGGGREQYESVETANSKLKIITEKDYELDDETILMRRQLQMENEVEYRKFVAEAKRSDLMSQETAKRRVPHPSDPKYDPFKSIPGYRPQDSKALAQWLKRQRESGRTASGVSLQTKEGQERFYNEEKMATQYHANPFSMKIEDPRGMQKARVTAYSPDSVFVNDQEVIGSCIVTFNRYFHWNVSSFEEINERTLALVMHLYPVPDVLFIGTGRNLQMIDEELRIALQKRGTIAHCLTTPQALAHFGMQLSVSRRAVLALVNPIPTNAYGRECFGDFIDNDMFSISDSAMGVPPLKQFSATLFRPNKVAEKYRHMQGTGFGPKYHILSDGRMVRPGTSGTKLRPMLEPGEDVDWEKLPSYYHWYPKEHVHDYIENTTWRELKGKEIGDPVEKRMRKQLRGEETPSKEEVPASELMPWDSASIPITKFAHERNDDEIIVEDPKTGRIIGMERATYDRWRKMMKQRREGKEETDPVEFDQERFVTNKEGVVFDLSKISYRPIFEGRWNPKRQQSTGRATPIMV